MRLAKETMLSALAASMAFTLARPKLKRLALRALGGRPGIKARLRRVAESRRVFPVATSVPYIAESPKPELNALTEDGRRVYEALQRARETAGRDGS
jgi:hypothetical protein